MKHFLSFGIIAISILLFSCTPQKRNDSPEGKEIIISNSISNQQVTSFAEDKLGHIWISTIRGLNKFNIYEFHQYFKSDDEQSICDNRIQHLYKDSRDRFWIGTINGICRYNEQDCFDHIPLESPSQNAIHFFENNDGKLFVNLSFQICAYNPDAGKFELVIENIDNKNRLSRCFIDKSNDLWIVTPYEIKCYNSSTYELKESFKPNNFITFTHLDNNGELWLASWHYLQIYDTRTGNYISAPKEITNHPILSKAMIINIHQYNNSSIIIQTQKDGLFLYNQITGTVIHQSESGFPFEVPDFEITTFYTDSHKNLWIGSYDQGFVTRFHYKERFNNNNFLKRNLEDESVINVTTDNDNNLWIITRSDGIKVYTNENKIVVVDQDILFPNSYLPFRHTAKKIYITNDNSIWLLSDWMLLRCEYKNEKVNLIKSYYFPEGILSITQDRNGAIWLGGMNEKIYVMKKGETEFSTFPLYGRAFKFTASMLTLSSGDILLATFGQELQLIDAETWEVTPIPILSHIKNSVFIPTSLFEDLTGDIWIGTMTNGLFRYSKENRTIENMEGTTCSDISSIIEDALGNIWVGTLFGLSKYDPTSQRFINYYKTDGIGGNQFNDQSACKMSDNTLILGGTHGLTFFNPIDVPYKRTIPLYFEDLKIHNKLEHPSISSCIDKHLPYNPDIKLKYYQNSFTISFAALDYCEFERVHYFYKLDGFDKFWIDAHNNREAYYSNLPAKKYTFRVKITNNEKTITEAENSINIKLSPAPWFSWPAIILYLILFEFLMMIIIRTNRRIKANKEIALQAEREKEQEHRINKMNMSFFANLSHEFRTPLTMISGPVTLLCNDNSIKGENKQLLYIIQRSVNRMLKLINQLMDFNKLENDALKLKVKPTDVIAELIRPIEVFSLNAKEKGIELKTYGLEDNFIMWLDCDKLEKITANLISNSLKFCETGDKIDISFDVINSIEASGLFELTPTDKATQYVKISVSDTGKGIPEDKLEKVFERYYQLDHQTKEFYNWGTGIGLYYSRRLVELHHGYIKAKNRPGKGVVFTFILPTTEEVYTLDERQVDEPASTYQLPVENGNNQQFAEKVSNGKQLKKLLVIDDDTDIIHYLKSLLSPYYSIAYKFNADDAYKAIKEVEPDLILCDVVMPGTNGFEFCRMIKDNPSFCHIPVVLVTAKATVENQVEGLNTGADAYVTKPFDPTYLIALINSQLKNREKIKNLLGSTTRTEKIDENILSPHDKTFMTNLFKLMENEISNSELNITRMTQVLKISRTKFYYKVKGLTGENPNVFFKKYKLNRAAELLSEGKFNISEIADMTGFSTLSHFSVSFKKQFGVSPSDYKEKN